MPDATPPRKLSDGSDDAGIVPEVAVQAVGAAFTGRQGQPGSSLGRTAAWGLLFFMGTVWGLTFSLAKIATSGGGHPLGLNYWQSVIGALVLIGVVIVRRQRIPVQRGHITFYVVCGLLGSIVPGILFYYAASRVSPGVLSITIATVPLMTFAIASLFGIEKLQIGRVLGVLLGIVSIILLVGPEESLPDPSAVPWIMTALIAAACYSAENMVVAMRMPANVSAFTVAAGMFIAAALIMTPMVFATGTFVSLAWPWGPSEWAVVSMATISVAAYSLFIYLITQAGPVFASQTAYIVTFSGVLWGVLIFDEQHSIWIWASLAVMLVALMLVAPRKLEAS